MGLAEWKETIEHEAAEAGFEVSDYQGFPLVKIPEGFDAKVRLLKLRFSVTSVKNLYAEGCLVTPEPIRR